MSNDKVQSIMALVDRYGTACATSLMPLGCQGTREKTALAAVESAIRAIAAPGVAQGWQPIATAPKDGTEILAWRQDAGAFIALYTSPSGLPMTQDEIDKCEEEWLFQEDWFTQWPQAIRLDGSEAPTHWMYLPFDPAPPIAEQPERPPNCGWSICSCIECPYWSIKGGPAE